MSLHPQTPYSIPEETARVAHAIFPQGNIYMRWFDALGPVFQDADFVELFPSDGQPALSPACLTLVLPLQFAEGLSDRQAADAVRTRIDWKYLLGLELTDPGFDFSVLSEFRQRLLEHQWEEHLLDQLLRHLRDQGLLKARGQQRTDSTIILGAVRDLNRLEVIGETLRHALEQLATVMPEWTRAHTPSTWVDRYGTRVQDYRLPSGQAQREAYAEGIGADGASLLQAIYAPDAPAWLRELPAVQLVRRVWLQNYTGRGDGRLRWRQVDELPPAAQRIRSPYDAEVRYCTKRETGWIGYKIHLTETCDADSPRIITQVETTLATTADGKMTTPIHQALQQKDLLPAAHLVDTGYLDAELLVTSQTEYGVNLVGPTRHDTGWQSHDGGNGFAATDFQIDWEKQQARCPAGKLSQFWTPAINNHGTAVIQIKFAKRDCRACPTQLQCTHSTPPRRTVTVRPQAHQHALKIARTREQTAAFKEQYAQRSGIEGTLSYGVRSFALRRTRYLGLAKTHLQHLLIATAMNVMRVVRWLAGEPFTQVRPTAFAPASN
ncbi:MAG: IS1182 family transposase [Chloroflexi bacterium]|nr:IS1182 family transposase [Chloroflexota bacterium]